MPEGGWGHKPYTSIMGGRAVLAAILGAAVAAIAVSLAGRLPKPQDDIEWLQREDAVIVQMRASGGLPEPAAANLARVPDFTLYGDGTLIVTDPAERGQFDRGPLFETTLSSGAVADLLEYLGSTGFLDFNYEQPRLGYYDFPTTYLYVNTKQGANAVGAYALEPDLPADLSAQWDQFRGLQAIKSRLDTIAAGALAGEAQDYQPEAILLIVQPDHSKEAGPSPTEWPFPELDLAAMLSDEAVGTRRVDGETAQAVTATLRQAGTATFLHNGRAFSLGYRPVLPYEEHFPEFEAPQQ